MQKKLSFIRIIPIILFIINCSFEWSSYQGELTQQEGEIKCLSIGKRLPTIEELKEAYKKGITKSWNGITYWSSTINGDKEAYFIDILEGFDYSINRNIRGHVRCISTKK